MLRSADSAESNSSSNDDKICSSARQPVRLQRICRKGYKVDQNPLSKPNDDRNLGMLSRNKTKDMPERRRSRKNKAMEAMEPEATTWKRTAEAKEAGRRGYKLQGGSCDGRSLAQLRRNETADMPNRRRNPTALARKAPTRPAVPTRLVE